MIPNVLPDSDMKSIGSNDLSSGGGAGDDWVSSVSEEMVDCSCANKTSSDIC